MIRHHGGLLLLGAILVARVVADELPGSALSLFDLYLAQAARTVTAYRTDIRLGGDPKNEEPGRQDGQSAFLGRFTYRPITYAELAPSERALLVHDPQFHAFLVSLGRASAHPGGGRPDGPPEAADYRFTIAPDEMLRSQPFVIVLPR